MTAGGFREVDDDLLADYLGGALDGTPQEAEVGRLVEADPAWAQAYALLSPAVAEVRADLARWAEPAPQLPPELAGRIAAALAGADPVPTEDPADAISDTVVSDTAVRDPGGPAAAAVVPTQSGGGPGRRPASPALADPARGTSTGPGRRSRRWARRATPLALAVAVAVAVVGLGLNRLADSSTGTAALDQPASAPEGASAAAPVRTTGPSLRSGTDYTPQTLGNASAGPTTKQRVTSSSAGQPGVDSEGGRRPAPGGLDQLVRLTDEAALTACLADIAAEHGAAPLVIEVIDYAAFRGEQALVIRFTDAEGARWAWVSGPECGVPGSGADTRYQARVG
ncbi:hypothetical protein ACFOW4_11270 [Micromonospora sp. GCM10011542]|uniref:hypothetical protein n=1 Tax=Micromonospora sp. GCM10011542 TaxID=3317337 RepID=UPI00360EC057